MKIIVINGIPKSIYISVRKVKKPYMTVKYKWVFLFYTSYHTTLTYPGISLFSILFSPLLNDMAKTYHECFILLLLLCHFANALVSSAFLEIVNINEKYDIISSECCFMELTKVLIWKRPYGYWMASLFQSVTQAQNQLYLSVQSKDAKYVYVFVYKQISFLNFYRFWPWIFYAYKMILDHRKIFILQNLPSESQQAHSESQACCQNCCQNSGLIFSVYFNVRTWILYVFTSKHTLKWYLAYPFFGK